MAVNLYAYKSGNSLLHRLPPPLKLLGLFLISGVSFLAFPIGLICAVLALAAGLCLAKISVGVLFRGGAPLLFMALLPVLSRSVSWEPLGFTLSGFWEGISYGAGLLVSFGTAGLFFSVTTMTELKDALDGAARHLPALRRLSLGISLMLGFLPRFFEVWEDADLAYQARGGKNNVRKLFLLVPLITERMIEQALETAAALEMRGLE